MGNPAVGGNPNKESNDEKLSDISSNELSDDTVRTTNNLGLDSKALADVIDDVREVLGTDEFEIRQELEVTYGDTTVTVDFIRDSDGNVIDHERYFENLPSIDNNGVISYDNELSVLEGVLKNPENWYDMDQYAFETDPKDSFDLDLEYIDDNFSSNEYPLSFKVIGVEIEQ